MNPNLIIQHPRTAWIKDIKSYDEQRKELWKIIEDYTGNTVLVEFAAKLIKLNNVPARDEKSLVRYIQLFVQKHIKFFREYPERWQSPLQTLALGIGDCDDKTILAATLMRTFRIPVQLVFLRFKKNGETPYSHVYPRAKINNKWVAVETVRSEFKLGDDPEKMARNKGFNVSVELIGDETNGTQKFNGS
jgi:transglutaminase-like putative cysteine protease